MQHLPSFLFLARDGADRAPMAAALLGARVGASYDIISAGLLPGAVSPMARQVMAEVGIDLPASGTCWLGSLLGRRTFSWAVSLRGRQELDAPRFFPGCIHLESWDVPSPLAEGGNALDAYRRLRQRLTEEVDRWLDQQAHVESDPREELASVGR